MFEICAHCDLYAYLVSRGCHTFQKLRRPLTAETVSGCRRTAYISQCSRGGVAPLTALIGKIHVAQLHVSTPLSMQASIVRFFFFWVRPYLFADCL